MLIQQCYKSEMLILLITLSNERRTFILIKVKYWGKKSSMMVKTGPSQQHWVIRASVLHSDLEKSVEELQRNSSVNHGLVTEQDVEQKSKELRMLGETLTELKSKCCHDQICDVLFVLWMFDPLKSSHLTRLEDRNYICRYWSGSV